MENTDYFGYDNNAEFPFDTQTQNNQATVHHGIQLLRKYPWHSVSGHVTSLTFCKVSGVIVKSTGLGVSFPF